MAPLDAARRYEGTARRHGVTESFAKSITEPTRAVETSEGYPRLVAALYATTLPPPRRKEAAAGCAEELARSIEG